MVGCEPISQAYADPANAFDATNVGGKFRTEQSRVGGLVGNPSNRCQAEVDRGRCQLPLLKEDSVSEYDRPIEREPRFRTVPVDEFGNRARRTAIRFWKSDC